MFPLGSQIMDTEDVGFPLKMIEMTILRNYYNHYIKPENEFSQSPQSLNGFVLCMIWVDLKKQMRIVLWGG